MDWIQLAFEKKDSRYQTFDRLSRALARHNNCFCPADKLAPPASRRALSPPKDCTRGIAKQLLMAFHISESRCKLRGSIFSLMVPENKKGSCGTIAMRLRKVLSGSVAMSTVSIVILPRYTGATRRRAASMELFPAPVRPTIPTRSQDDVLKSTPASEEGKWSLRRKERKMDIFLRFHLVNTKKYLPIA